MRHTELSDADYVKFYRLEDYLFSEVSPRFTQTHTLSEFDFFWIVIWKANRAKSKIAHRLIAAGFDDLSSAVTGLASDITRVAEHKDRLRVLVQKWGFRLPMASAILTVLYPEEFTVYDVRVCDVLGDFSLVQHRVNFDALWVG